MKILPNVLAFSMIIGLTACDKAPPTPAKSETSTTTTTSTTPVTANQVTYHVGTISSFPPFVTKDEKGKSIGFDIDILNAIGEKQDFKLDYLVSPWDGLLNMLNSGQRDIVIAGVIVTPERQTSYDFSNPYIENRWAVLAEDKSQEGKPNYATLGQALNSANLVAVETGSAPETELKKVLSSHPEKIKSFDTQFLAVQSMIQGKTDMVYDLSTLLDYYKTSTTANGKKFYTLADTSAIPQPSAFVVKKGNTELLNKLNKGLEQIKAEGTYDKIYKKWFGDTLSTTITTTSSVSTTAATAK